MTRGRPANLRTVLSVAAVLVTLLATTAALSLVLATNVLQRMTADIAQSVESVRTIEEAEVTLLLHVRAYDPEEERELASQLTALLDEADQYVSSVQEAVVLSSAKLQVGLYLQRSIEPGDVEEGLNAASQIGDDMIQKRAQGYVVPEGFTHGSAEQRVSWFRRGIQTGDLKQCDTFARGVS